VIIITHSVKYVIDKKGTGYNKEADINEFRFLANVDMLNKLIGQLQLLVQNANQYDQMAAALNTVISANKTP